MTSLGGVEIFSHLLPHGRFILGQQQLIEPIGPRNWFSIYFMYYIMYFGDWPHIHPCPNSTDPLHKISQMVTPQSFSDFINFNMSTSQQPYPSSKRKLYQPSGFKTPT